MKTLRFIGMMLLATAMVGMTSCSKSDDNKDNGSGGGLNLYGLFDDSFAGAAPSVSSNTVTISNISAPSVEAGTNGLVGNFNLSGVQAADGDYLSLFGTGSNSQNIWLTIDGIAKALDVINANSSTKAAVKGQADIVFLIDNSGSMDDEADAVAAEILTWAKSLSNAVDARFACVGYGDNYYGVDGGMDLDDVTVLNEFLNNRPSHTYGTSRTQDFFGTNATKLETAALSESNGFYNGSYWECGGLALHFADQMFSWRSGANRIFINFTDEPNQPNSYKEWSVETVNPKSQLYNWSASKGTVHTVYSGEDEDDYKAPDGYYYTRNEASPYTEYEKPWAMSEYTGGASMFAKRDFSGVTLSSLEVTAAIQNSYVIRFNITDNLKSGNHNVTITIKDGKGNEAVKTFSNLTFALGN